MARVLQNNVVVTLLLALMFVEVWSLFGVGLVAPGVEEGVPVETPLKISEIDGPRIDTEAASIVVDDEEAPLVASAAVFPGQFWVFLLLAYVALLVFNLSYTFENVVTPQWFWETLYTFLALVTWMFLDSGALYTWFPLMVIKLALLIFVLYVYLLEKRGLPDTQEPKTEPLF